MVSTQPADSEAIAALPREADEAALGAAATTTGNNDDDMYNEKHPQNAKVEAAFDELAHAKRGLKQRHIQMIAVAGTIGTGLFLATGKALANGGPLGVLLGYAVMGGLIMALVFSVAEMSALVPLSGGIIRHAEYFFDPALAFAQGWNSVYANAILLPAEMVACAVIIDYWSHINHAVWIVVLGGLLIFSNFLLISVYGELEFVCAILKIVLIVGINIMVSEREKERNESPFYILAACESSTLSIVYIYMYILTFSQSICITAGAGPKGEVIGFKYWNNPGPFVHYLGIPGSWGQFIGFWRVLVSAAYAFSNVENLSVAGAETVNPRYNIPKAAKRIFWRIALLYLVTVFFMGMVVRSDNKALTASSGNAGASPFAIAAIQAGIKVVPSIINAVVVTSAWSAGNSGTLNILSNHKDWVFYDQSFWLPFFFLSFANVPTAMLVGTRTLYGLALEGHAPKVFTKMNRFGTPWVSVSAVASLMLLGFMTLSSGANVVFGWFQDLVSAASFVHWINILLIYLRFYYGCRKQGISRDELPWKSPFQPYAAWIALVSFTLLLLTGGFYVFVDGHWSATSFVSSYFNIPLILVLYFGYKFARKTELVKLEDMPIRAFLEVARRQPEDLPPKAQGWRRFNILWG